MARNTNKVTSNLKGGLNQLGPYGIEPQYGMDMTNVYYNIDGRLASRRGYRTFGDDLGSAPITSYFFYTREDNKSRIAVCHSGSSVYKYVEGSDTWSSLYANNQEYETIPWLSTYRTRRDHQVYKNILYMTNGVSPYQKYDGTTHSLIGVGGSGTVTADSGTNLLTKVSHGYTANYEIYMTSSGTMPGGLTAYQVYYVIVNTVNTFYVSLTPGGTAIDLTTNGTGTISTFDLTERRMRYITFAKDRLYSSGNDQYPTKVYYTDVNPSDGTNLNQNEFNAGADDIGKVNALLEYQDGILIFADKKTYFFHASSGLQRLDTQGGSWGNRFARSVDNTLVHISNRGIDALKYRDGVGGVDGLVSGTLSDKIPYLLQYMTKDTRNLGAGWYNQRLSNYMMAISSDGGDGLDTVICYNARTGAFTTYDYACSDLYDFGIYINDAGSEKQIMTCADGRAYEYDYGWDDNGTAIATSVSTSWLSIAGETETLEVEYVEWSGWIETGGTIYMDVNLNNDEGSVVNEGAITVGTADDGQYTVYPSDNYYDGIDDGKVMVKVVKRFPIYRRASAVHVQWDSSGVQWVLESVNVKAGGEVYDLFPYTQIG